MHSGDWQEQATIRTGTTKWQQERELREQMLQFLRRLQSVRMGEAMMPLRAVDPDWEYNS